MITDYFPIMDDIKDEYTKLRRHGHTRQGALNELFSTYENEMLDEEDSCQVWIGIASALASKNELTEQVRDESFVSAKKLNSFYPEASNDLLKFIDKVSDVSNLGPEARYPQKRIYDPKWNIGDTFIHELAGDYPRELGIEGMYSVLRKVDELYDEDCEVLFQKFLVTICSKDSIPHNTQELDALGYIPQGIRERKNEPTQYYVQINLWTSSKMAVNRFNLEYIGCFPDARLPEGINRGPEVYMPRKNRDYITERVCYSYKEFGVVKEWE